MGPRWGSRQAKWTFDPVAGAYAAPTSVRVDGGLMSIGMGEASGVTVRSCAARRARGREALPEVASAVVHV